MYKSSLFLAFLTLPTVMFGCLNPKWNGKFYDEHSTPQFKSAKESVQLLGRFKGNENVADFGCGTGNISALMASKVHKGSVIGIDSSPTMIETAQKKHQKVKNLSFIQSPLETMGFRGLFDKALCVACFMYVKEQGQALGNMYQSLKPGGKLVLEMSKKSSNPRPIKRALFEVGMSKKWKQHVGDLKTIAFYPQEKDSLELLLTKAGFKATVQEGEINFSFETQEAFAEWLPSWLCGFEQFNKIPKEKLPEFLKEVVKKYVQYEPLKEDGTVKYILPKLTVVATKPE